MVCYYLLSSFYIFMSLMCVMGRRCHSLRYGCYILPSLTSLSVVMFSGHSLRYGVLGKEFTLHLLTSTLEESPFSWPNQLFVSTKLCCSVPSQHTWVTPLYPSLLINSTIIIPSFRMNSKPSLTRLSRNLHAPVQIEQTTISEEWDCDRW